MQDTFQNYESKNQDYQNTFHINKTHFKIAMQNTNPKHILLFSKHFNYYKDAFY